MKTEQEIKALLLQLEGCRNRPLIGENMDKERIKTVIEGALTGCTITRFGVNSFGDTWFDAITNNDIFRNSPHKGIEIIEVKTETTGLGIYGCIEGKYLSKLYDDENRN